MSFEAKYKVLELAYAICRDSKAEEITVDDVIKIAKKLDKYLEQSPEYSYNTPQLLFPAKKYTQTEED